MAKVEKGGSVTVKVTVPFVVIAEKSEMKAAFAIAKQAVTDAVKIVPPKRVPLENGKIRFPQAE